MSNKRMRVEDVRLGDCPAPDLLLRLRSGEVVETYSSVVSLGSAVLRFAMELELAEDGIITVPLDVSSQAMKMALDTLLPPFLQRNAKVEAFSPLKRLHRDFIRSIEYLGVPDLERLISDLPKQERFVGEPASSGVEEDLAAFNFILTHPGSLSMSVERWFWTTTESRAQLKTGYLSTVLARCRKDPKGELADTVRTVMGRVFFNFAGI
jgi:hypothetical protein